MTWRHPTEQDWDRARDYAKHEPRPTDPPLPARMVIPLSKALEVAVNVKGMKNVRDAAKLVDQYARTEAAGISLDRKLAIIKLVGYCEGLVNSGELGELEPKLRAQIAEVLAAFDLPSKSELATDRIIDVINASGSIAPPAAEGV